jgi:hypothetical protein
MQFRMTKSGCNVMFGGKTHPIGHRLNLLTVLYHVGGNKSWGNKEDFE